MCRGQRSRPHTHYIAAVEAELARRGVQVSEWHLDDRLPLVGYLRVRRANPGADAGAGTAVVFGWCEERGWFHGRGPAGPGGFDGTRPVGYLGGVVLPAPPDIAGQLARVVTRGHLAEVAATEDTVTPTRRYRAHTDDDGLRAWLAAYAPPTRDHPTGRA